MSGLFYEVNLDEGDCKMSDEAVFQLDMRLMNDTKRIAAWPLCDLLLMNDRQYPWCILVPRVPNMSEIYHLSKSQRQQLDLESNFLAKTLMHVFDGDKLNVAALGNVVKQLHIHHIVRYSGDPAWPAPVWGRQPIKAYHDDELKVCLEQLSILKEPDWASIDIDFSCK